jgi:hypothetical protein
MVEIKLAEKPEGPVSAIETSTGVILPIGRIAAVSKSPSRMLIYSSPKAGKTTLVAGLDDCLLLDLEKGSGFVEAMRYKCENTTDIYNFTQAVKARGVKYKYLAVDTVTALEAMCIPLAKTIYLNTPQGKNYKGDNVLHLPDGGGYIFLRNAMEMMLGMLQDSCERLILLGHLKDKFLGAKAGIDVNAKDLDLTGKIKNIACANADAIGYLYRKGQDTILSFKTSDEILCGARPAHLKNKDLVMATEQPDGSIKTFWEKIFID